MSEAPGGAVATTSDVNPTQPVTQTEGNQTETSAAEQQPGTAPGNEQEQQPETPEKRESRNKRRLDHWKQQAAYWKGQAEATGRQSEGASKTNQASPPAGSGDAEPKRDAFESYEDFIAAKAEFRAEKRADERVEKRLKEADEKRSRERASEEQQSLAKSWDASVEAARKEIDDFDEVVGESEAPTTHTMSRALQELPHGAKVLHYLAKHPDEAERIAKLTPVRQVAEIGKLEDKVSQLKPSPKTPSKAPAPINTLGGTNSTATTSLNDKMPIGEWMAKRNAEVRGPR